MPGSFSCQFTAFDERMVFERLDNSRAESLGLEFGYGPRTQFQSGDQRRLFGRAMRRAIRQALTAGSQPDPCLGQRALGLAATLARGQAQGQYLAQRVLIVVSGPGK